MKTRRSRTFSPRSRTSSGNTRTERSSSTATSTRSAPGPSAPRPPRSIDALPLGVPLFVLNLKVYPDCLGAGAVRIGRAFENALQASGVAGAIAPATPDLGVLAQGLKLPVVAQHADAFEAGPHTGYVVPEAIAAAGGIGSIVNHSEHPLAPPEIAAILERLAALGLEAILCARDVEDSRRLAHWHPRFLAVEPPELIGGTRSVSTAQPALVSGTVSAVREVWPSTHVLCGAGIHTRLDVRRALELGAEGILVSSAVTRAADPAQAIAELLAGFP
jgi:triosephosphate isomerase (TIM)